MLNKIKTSKKIGFPKIFKALLIIKKKNKFNLKIKNISANTINNNDVVIKVAYASLNYKDALMFKGNAGLAKKYPHVPGIDCSGIIVHSNSKKFITNEKVMVVGRPIGVKTFGSLAEFIVVPDSWIEKIPNKMNLKNTIIFGTAGLAAMLAVNTVINNKLNKNYPILVTGASGGVGILSVYILSKFGYEVSCISRNIKNYKLLKKLGSSEIIDPKKFYNLPNMPLLKIKFSGIIDNIGGAVISLGLKQLINNGAIISVGNASSEISKINIMPLILRGVKIIGINAESTSEKLRRKVWKNISTIVNDKKIKLLYQEYSFKNSVKALNALISSNHFGRIIIKF
jgi:putative YhdH/YhfP family quinone oxidoreductase